MGISRAGGSTGTSGHTEDPIINSNISSGKSNSSSPLPSEGRWGRAGRRKGTGVVVLPSPLFRSRLSLSHMHQEMLTNLFKSPLSRTLTTKFPSISPSTERLSGRGTRGSLPCCPESVSPACQEKLATPCEPQPAAFFPICATYVFGLQRQGEEKCLIQFIFKLTYLKL